MASAVFLCIGLLGLGPGPDALPQQGLLAALDRGWAEPRPEWVQMAIAILRGEALRTDRGWWRSAGAARDWAWLAARFDADDDGVVTRRELPLADDAFACLDRDSDGAVKAADLELLAPEPEARIADLFGRLDADANGRVTRGELEAFFDRADSGALGFLTPDDLEGALRPGGARASGPDAPEGGADAPGGGPPPRELLAMLLDGQLGSLGDGPAVGAMAPDFTLQRLGGPEAGAPELVQLSALRGRRPVALVFGSFT